jgi:hypothetical protein
MSIASKSLPGHPRTRIVTGSEVHTFHVSVFCHHIMQYVWIGHHFVWGLGRAWAQAERLVSRAINEQTGLRPVCHEYRKIKWPRTVIYISLTFLCISLTRQSKIMPKTQSKAGSDKSSNVAWTGPDKACPQLQSWVRCNGRFHTAVEKYYILSRAWTQAHQAQLDFRTQRPDLSWTEPRGTVSLPLDQLQSEIWCVSAKSGASNVTFTHRMTPCGGAAARHLNLKPDRLACLPTVCPIDRSVTGLGGHWSRYRTHDQPHVLGGGPNI